MSDDDMQEKLRLATGLAVKNGHLLVQNTVLLIAQAEKNGDLVLSNPDFLNEALGGFEQAVRLDEEAQREPFGRIDLKVFAGSKFAGRLLGDEADEAESGDGFTSDPLLLPKAEGSRITVRLASGAEAEYRHDGDDASEWELHPGDSWAGTPFPIYLSGNSCDAQASQYVTAQGRTFKVLYDAGKDDE